MTRGALVVLSTIALVVMGFSAWVAWFGITLHLSDLLVCVVFVSGILVGAFGSVLWRSD